MSESYMRKGLEAQKPTEVMMEGLRAYATDFLRWGEGAPAVFAAPLRMRRLRFAHGTSYL